MKAIKLAFCAAFYIALIKIRPVVAVIVALSAGMEALSHEEAE